MFLESTTPRASISSETQDERTCSSIAQAFDGTVELRRTDDGCQIRTLGLPDRSDDWQPFEPIRSRA